MEFDEVVSFHGHVCPGLAMGYRVAQFAAKSLAFKRSGDEEIVAVVENNSCAVDAIQMVLGCTFGKGNFIFKDYGKQVYTFFKRSSGDSLRVAVRWTPPQESEKTAVMWKRFRSGERSQEVVDAVGESKSQKVKAIFDADEDELFQTSPAKESLPDKAQIVSTVSCSACGDKLMETKSVTGPQGEIVCLPCSKLDAAQV